MDAAPVLFDRASSYIGVMVDDLVLQGITEPYRMLTARAEHRLALRADNAETRLGEMAGAAGLLGPERAAHQSFRRKAAIGVRDLLTHSASANEITAAGSEVAEDGVRRSLFDWLRFPNVGVDQLIRLQPELASVEEAVLEEVVVDGRYAPYLQRLDRQRAQEQHDRAIGIPADLDYARIPGLSNEMRERLFTARPSDMSAAARIRGMTPAGLAALLVSLKRKAA
jgi:tRNA uridine 5-carboxymethylaminomethyl modification enzyme